MLDHPARRKSPGKDASPDGAEEHACHGRTSCAKTRILVVEDDEFNGRILVRLLVASGYEAVHVPDYRAALKTACEWLPDLLVCDIDLHANRDGCDVLKTMRQGYPGLRAISVSGHEPRQAEVASRGAGFEAHLSKPFEFQTLVETIELALRSRRKLPRPAAASQTLN